MKIGSRNLTIVDPKSVKKVAAKRLIDIIALDYIKAKALANTPGLILVVAATNDLCRGLYERLQAEIGSQVANIQSPLSDVHEIASRYNKAIVYISAESYFSTFPTQLEVEGVSEYIYVYRDLN